MKLYRRRSRGRRTSGRSASRASARPPRPRRARHLGGLGGLRRAARASRRLPARPSQAASTVRLRLLALRPLRPGLHPHPDRLRPRDRRGHRRSTAASSTRPPTWSSATAARSRASTATASRAAELLPKMFGAGAGRAFGEFKAIWDPDNKMNPGKVVDPYSLDREPAAGHRLRPAAAADPLHASRRRRQLRPRDRCAASASGECRRERGRHDVPELHGDPRGEALDPRPRAPALRDARRATRSTDGWRNEHGARRRSTSASPARAARASAR